MTAPTLDEFLRARLDETEARARESARYGDETDVDLILATVAAQQLIIEHAYSTRLQAERAGDDPTDPFVAVFRAQVIVYDSVMRTLATAYDGHPDYRETWDDQ